jgi:uncharacterized phage protein gp47/JayE
VATQSDVAAQIVATLAITEPDLDTAIGSVTRKIIDAVSQQIADSYTDDHLLTYQYDIDSKIEADLDDFVQLFGITRIAAKRATGTVVFQRGSGDTTLPIAIPVNTQIASSQIGAGNSTIIVQTVTPGFMGQGVSTVEVPVQAVEPGLSGNVAAGLLTRFRSPIEGILSVTNVQPLTGGVGQETDSELRARWKRTVFRSLAGTESMYLGIALNDDDCFGANVVGATKTFTEQVQIGTDLRATSSLTDVMFVYPETAMLGPHLASSQVLLRNHDFRLDTSTNPPTVVMLISDYPTGEVDESGNALTAPVAGSIFDLTYEYAPSASRNLPRQGITNRVDVWCAGVRAQNAVQAVVFQANKRFRASVGSPYYRGNFRRMDETMPSEDNIFIPLAFGPIITIPSSLVVGDQTFYQSIDYHLVHDDTAFGYAANSRFGIEWEVDSLPDVLSPAPVFIVGENEDYTYNAMVADIQSGIERWRLVGIDALAHAAKLQALRFNIAVMYDRSATPEVTNGLIEEAIQAYLRTQSFDSTVQVSDVIQAIHGAPGVDNVRFLDSRDWPTYDSGNPNAYGVGIQRVIDGDVVESYVDHATGSAIDFSFGDSEIPVFESIRGDKVGVDGTTPSGVPAIRAQNTFFLPVVP